MHIARPGDRFEVPVAGFVVDVMRGDDLIEIQTGNFGGLGKKLDAVLDHYDLTLVHPIPVRTMIHRPGRKPRRSPVRRTIYHLFDELVRIPTLIEHPRLTLHVLLIEENQQRVHDPSLRRRRGGWRVTERSLAAVVDDMQFRGRADLAALLPEGLANPFTTADLAHELSIARGLAQKMAYCLRLMECIEPGRRTRTGIEYRRAPEASTR